MGLSKNRATLDQTTHGCRVSRGGACFKSQFAFTQIKPRHQWRREVSQVGIRGTHVMSVKINACSILRRIYTRALMKPPSALISKQILLFLIAHLSNLIEFFMNINLKYPPKKKRNQHITPKPEEKERNKDDRQPPKPLTTQPLTMYKETTGLPPGRPFRFASQPTSFMVFAMSFS